VILTWLTAARQHGMDERRRHGPESSPPIGYQQADLGVGNRAEVEPPAQRSVLIRSRSRQGTRPTKCRSRA
jgi:hypothetical protein